MSSTVVDLASWLHDGASLCREIQPFSSFPSLQPLFFHPQAACIIRPASPLLASLLRQHALMNMFVLVSHHNQRAEFAPGLSCVLFVQNRIITYVSKLIIPQIHKTARE